jgi:hypothetical protein
LLLTLVGSVGCGEKKEAPQALVLGPLPYQAAESWEYLQTVNGQPAARLTTTVKKGTGAEADAWIFETTVAAEGAGGQAGSESSTVWANAVTLRPVRTEIKGSSPAVGDYTIALSYSGSEAVSSLKTIVSFSATTPKGPQSGSLTPDGILYDNDQILMLVRALPLADGYRANLQGLQGRNVKAYQVELQVVGTDDVKLEDETVHCFKVRLSSPDGAQFLWYACDADHRLVKVETPAGTMLLQPAVEK